MALTTFERALRGAKGDLRAHLLSVFSVGVAFVCLVATLLVVVNVERVQERWESVGRLSVYLKPGTNNEQVATLEQALRGTKGIQKVRYLSSEAARRELLREDPDEVLSLLPEQAFPASLEVETVEPMSLEQRQRITAQLGSLPSVETVEGYENYSHRLGTTLVGAVTAAVVLAFIVLLAVISVVSSTMRLSLQRRSLEVEVLRLVGATDDYVRQPFLVEGMLQGAAGALFAIVLVFAMYLSLRGTVAEEFSQLLGVGPSFLPFALCLGLIASGALMGVFAAYLSLRKMLVA
jgi:cell division transport system permease protein